MSVAEITEQLEHMSIAERAEIARALLRLRALDESQRQQPTNFAEAKAYVFDHYGELLRRLAQ